MYLDELEPYCVKKWMDFFKYNSLLTKSVIGETPLATTTANKFSLNKFNIIKDSINIDPSGSNYITNYLPYNLSGTQISDIIVSGTLNPFTVDYQYNNFAILTRSKKEIDAELFKTPRLFVLWVSSLPGKERRQLNSEGKIVTKRRCIVTILVDVDESMGGYPKKAELTSLVSAAIDNGREELFANGFEDIEIEDVTVNEDYDSEEPLALSRGVIMVAFTAYPILKRE